MGIKFNGKTITENRYIGSIIMAFAVMLFPLIPIGMITILGEALAHYHIMGLAPGIYLSAFGEMWIGGIITLIGVMFAFGREGSGLSINNQEKKR